MQFSQKICLITGAAGGIGLAIATRYAKEGAQVILADIKEEAALAAAAGLHAQGYKALGLAMNVGNEDSVNAGVARIIAQFGAIDVLVSNAGVQIIHPIESFPFADWQRMLAIHLDGAFLTTKACFGPMRTSRRGGCIIYMGSVHSKLASPLKSAYVTAKHGLMGLAKVIAKEGAEHKIRTHVLCPGFVRTPLVEKQIPEQAQALGLSEAEVVKNIMLKDTVDGEFTTLEEVADAAFMFASANNAALTGQSLVVSHGWFMQ